MKKIWKFIKRLLNTSKHFIESFVKPSISVVQAIKAIVDSPALPLLTTLIPGSIDDLIANKIRAYLPTVLKVLGYAEQCISTSPDALVQCALSKIRTMSAEQRDYAYHNIAVSLSRYLSDGKLSLREAIHLAEEIYQTEFKAA